MSMVYKELLLVAHLKHFKGIDGVYSYEPYVRELIYWSNLFDRIVLYTEMSTEKPSFALSRLPENIVVHDLGFVGGPGLLNNLKRVFRIPSVVTKLLIAYLKADLIHTRSSGIPTMAINVFNLLWNKPTIEKWATNSPPDPALGLMTALNYKLLVCVPSNTRVLVYAPVDHSRFVLSFPALFSSMELDRNRLMIDDNKWRLSERSYLCVSRLHKDKNVELLLDAVKYGIMSKELSEKFKVHIVGGGPQEYSIRSFVYDNGLEENIQLMGKMSFENTLKMMAESHFLIMPGINEGWGKVINEALSVDCIPLVVKGGNAENVMRRMENPGLLFENTPDSLVSTIKMALSTPMNIVHNWLEKGNRHNSNFTLENYIKVVEKTYDEITSLRH